ncbi:hypothetical protein HPP92_016284 [Vanilla planifolia]|uniref:Uncharacterized protein n=1 Tax=Vanilla planifolia TaxID=51239 RepID=A0A835QND2_VANPL|nr:hypothetical protein HPP92_016284 [Vanilla planifolia]
MGRPPCCDKAGVKKGPWTPEEDIMLVSYIQEHGPGNWRSVPTKTGLSRCSKSCRLRWTNYLRPGIKRGNFTEQEEKLIIHLQALLGNRWAAMASYLPERTDNDIKNYWNTHLKKKLRRIDTEGHGGNHAASGFSKGQWERRLQTDIDTARLALQEALLMEGPVGFLTEKKPFLSGRRPVPTSTYASSAENISRLLENWKRRTPDRRETAAGTESSSSAGTAASVTQNWGRLSPETGLFQEDSKPSLEAQLPLSLLETWLLDESYTGASDVCTTLDVSMDGSDLL